LIYFARRSNGTIKIGVTSAPGDRLKQLQRQYGEIEIVGVLDGGLKQEKILHKHFKHLNTHKDGREFFYFGEELDKYIAVNTRPLTVKMPRLAKGQKINRIVRVRESTKEQLREFANGIGANYDECIQWMLSRFIEIGEHPMLVGLEFRDRFMSFKTKPADELPVVLPRPAAEAVTETAAQTEISIKPVVVREWQAQDEELNNHPVTVDELQGLVQNYRNGQPVSFEQRQERKKST